MTKKKRNNKKGRRVVRKTNTTPTQGQKTANKPSKSTTSVHKSTTAKNTTKRQSVPRRRTINKKNKNLKPAKQNNFFRMLFNIISGKSVRKKVDLRKQHPRFPFWARLRIEKNRTTLVIDEEKSLNKKTNKIEDQFVHREATSPNDDETRNKKYERISPNPDKDKAKEGIDMLLKSPRKLPKDKFKMHNKDLDMPKHLKDKYEKNNHKDKKT